MTSTHSGMRMLMESKISIDRLTGTIETALRVTGDFAKKNVKEIYLVDAHEQLKLSFERYLALDKGHRVSSLTQAIKEADQLRDTRYKALLTGVEFAAYQDLPATREAVKLISQVLKENKVKPYASYAEETGQLNRLLEHFKQAPYQEALTSLNLLPQVVSLTNAEKAFQELHRQQLEEKGDYTAGQMQAQKKEVIKHYNHMIRLVDSISDSRVAPPIYQDLRAKMEVITKDAMAPARRKAHKKLASERPTDLTEK